MGPLGLVTLVSVILNMLGVFPFHVKLLVNQSVCYKPVDLES